METMASSCTFICINMPIRCSKSLSLPTIVISLFLYDVVCFSLKFTIELICEMK
uniref:Uncharacterized protein n=1 Tax=Arundo donax TaxID=35708 RepID=A0A0A9D651_ARUDO